MIKIKRFIGRKLDYITGILRVQMEIDRLAKKNQDIKIDYIYYEKPMNFIDFFSKRYILYPIKINKQTLDSETIIHIGHQHLGDLALFSDKKRTIISCMDIFNFYERNNWRNPIFLQKYARLGMKKCNYIISISDFTKQELINKFNIPQEKIEVIKLATNPRIFFPIPQEKRTEIEPFYPNDKKILFVGTEEYRKDVFTLFKAFYLIKKQVKNIKLIRVGSPMYPDIIKNLGLEKDIIYIKNINNERLNEIYNLCDIFVFPSIYEGFGLPGLEAASSGIPVICSDIQIFREIYQDFPIYFPPRDYKSLAIKILESIYDEPLLQEMIKKGFRVASLYSWENSANKYINLLKNIVNNL